MSNIFTNLSEEDLAEKVEPIKPLWTVKRGDDTTTWIKNTFRALMKKNSGYFEEIKENLKLYKGDVFTKPKSSAGGRTISEGDPQLDKARNAKLYDNKIFESVDWRVNTHNAQKPGIDIGPANVDFSDRVGSEVAKAVVDTIWYLQDEDEMERSALRHAFIAGEHYLGVLWDPDSGDVHPEYAAALQQSENGKLKLGGRSYDSNNPIRIGDVVYKHFPAWRVLPEPVEVWGKVTYLMTWDIEYLEAVKKDYPRIKDLVNNSAGREQLEGFDEDYLSRLREEGKILVLTVYEKKHKRCPEGRYIKSTVDGVILEDRESPYSHSELPLSRLTDLDLPGELRGRSFLRNIKGLQYQQFFATSMAAANLRLMGHPKWSVESGSININDLTNARTVIQRRQGSAAPAILQPNSTGADTYKQIADLDLKIDTKVKGNFATAQALPARIDSALALQYLDEKDLNRNHTMFSKVNAWRVANTQLTLKVSGQYYAVEDKRLLRIMGQNHAYDIKYFKLADFNRPYTVRVKSGSALPDQKSARIDAILKINAEAPGQITPAQLTDLLQLGSVEKFFDITTKSLKAAESIVQDLITGNPVPPPEGYEDLMTYWRVFGTYMQDRQFKESVPPPIKDQVKTYLMTIEMLMFKKGLDNQAFQAQLQGLALYPLVFTLPEAPAELAPLAPVTSAIGGAKLPEALAVRTTPISQPDGPSEPGGPAAGPPAPGAAPGAEVHAASDLMRSMVSPQDIKKA